MVNQLKVKRRKIKVFNFIALFLLVFNGLNAQIVEEVVQIDTTLETIRVIYKPEIASTYYFKKVAVFADDTAQIAVEKSYTNYGQNGVYKVYYPSGRLKIKTVFANNKIHGECVYYDPEGIIITKGVYREGIKHGYWAYKSLKIYGRYKKGYKHGKWKRFDNNEDKFISHYKAGELKAGEGFGNEIPFYLNTQKKIDKTPAEENLENPVEVKDTTRISKEYEQAIAFLTGNVMFRKALKKHFGTSMKKSVAIKKQYDKDRFQFKLSPEIKALDLSKFIKSGEDNKIVVERIDKILKAQKPALLALFSGNKISDNQHLFNNSTDKESQMVITFSAVKMNLMRLDVDWTFKEEKSKFRILLYFDNDGVLKGAEYESP